MFLWLVGGWFALVVAVTLLVGRMLSMCSTGDPQETVGDTASARPSIKQGQRTR
jgi:hypothetical protein